MQIPNQKVVKSELLSAVIENSSVAIFLFESQQLFYSNRAGRELLAVDDSSSPHASDVLPSDLFNVLKDDDHEQETIQEVELRFASGESKWMEASISQLEFDDKVFQQLTLKDISKSKRRESELLKEATTDDLSGLGNRRQFRRVLDCNSDQPMAIAMVDVDHFKGINDSFGHVVGDNAIRYVASQLLAHFSNTLCVARLGGEEFAVVSTFENRLEIEQQFENFRLSVQENPFSGQSIKLTVSIGLAFSHDGIEIPELLAQADKSLYQSKNAGRNRLTVYSN